MFSNPADKPITKVLSPAEAIAHYEEAIKAQPTAANYLELGAAYYIAHRWEDALRAFEKTAELNSGEPYAYYYLGVLYAAMGQRDKANDALAQLMVSTNNPMLKEQGKARIPQVRNTADLGGN